MKIEIKDKNMTVVGFARSGIGAANLLSELGANVTVTDIKTEEELKDFIPRLGPSVRLALGGHPEDIFLSSDMLVVSPGVPLDISPISKAKEKGIPIIGELELAYQIISSKFKVQSSKIGSKRGFLAITGTNGKSTTTALLGFMMKKGGFQTIIGGNIGNALTEEILKAVTSYKLQVTSKNQSQNSELKTLNSGLNFSLLTSHFSLDFIVAEVSSFQLESIKDFRPGVATILNITPDHLDRYLSFEEYGLAKARIFKNQGEGDFLVLNWDDPAVMKVKSEKLEVKSEKPGIFYFSRREKVEGLYLKDGAVYCNLPPMAGTVPILPPSAGKSGTVPFNLPLAPCPLPLIKADEIKIKGVHNLENAMPASAMALLAGCPVEAVLDSLREFSGLEHRLEFVRELEGVSYFNDSKGTNVGAVIKSLESFSEPIILIAGGRDKAGDFSLLRQLVGEKVKSLILIGEAGEKIRKALGDLAATVMAKDLKEAVEMSQSIAIKGDVVLLSPACASFDMFVNFEDRGRQFKKLVAEME